MKKSAYILTGIILTYFAISFSWNSMIGVHQVATPLSQGAKLLVDSLNFALPHKTIIDYHCHMVGAGSTSNCFVNPEMTNIKHIASFLKFKAYKQAAGINDEDNIDEEYLNRLIKLAAENGGKYRLLAFDKNHNKDGSPNLEKTNFYVPNEYVDSISKEYPEIFETCASIHPYRKDAIVELEKLGESGVKMIKWLPNAMSIDPSNPKCEAFYKIMIKYDMVLLSHAGHEKAVHAEEDQKYGNPLLLRKPLNMGVKVIIAHCAGLGENEDLDRKDKKLTSNFELFCRLMSEEKYEGLLFGDISAITQTNRLEETLPFLLNKKQWHHRLVNGSDYPLPGFNFLYSTKKLQKLNYITKQERELLNEIYDHNPLLFDRCLKMCLKDPLTGNQFEPSIFVKNSKL